MDHLKPHVSEREACVLPPSPSERHPIPLYAAQLASSGGTVTVSSVVHGTFSVLTTAMWARASPLKCTTGPSTCVCSSTTCASRTCARSHSQSKPVQNRPTHPDSQCSSSARQHNGMSRGATSSPARSCGPQSAACGTWCASRRARWTRWRRCTVRLYAHSTLPGPRASCCSCQPCGCSRLWWLRVRAGWTTGMSIHPSRLHPYTTYVSFWCWHISVFVSCGSWRRNCVG